MKTSHMPKDNLDRYFHDLLEWFVLPKTRGLGIPMTPALLMDGWTRLRGLDRLEIEHIAGRPLPCDFKSFKRSFKSRSGMSFNRHESVSTSEPSCAAGKAEQDQSDRMDLLTLLYPRAISHGEDLDEFEHGLRCTHALPPDSFRVMIRGVKRALDYGIPVEKMRPPADFKADRFSPEHLQRAVDAMSKIAPPKDHGNLEDLVRVVREVNEAAGAMSEMPALAINFSTEESALGSGGGEAAKTPEVLPAGEVSDPDARSAFRRSLSRLEVAARQFGSPQSLTEVAKFAKRMTVSDIEDAFDQINERLLEVNNARINMPEMVAEAGRLRSGLLALAAIATRTVVDLEMDPPGPLPF